MIYALKLCGDNYYVGFTDQPVERRVSQHRRGQGSVWTSLHGVEELIETRPGDRVDEDTLTLRYMYEFGIERVRGGPYVAVVLTEGVLAGIRLRLRMNFPSCGACSGLHPTRFCCKDRPGHIGAAAARKIAAALAAYPDLAAAIDASHGPDPDDAAALATWYGSLGNGTIIWITTRWPDRVRAAFGNLQDAAMYDELPELLDPRAAAAPGGSVSRYRDMRRVLDAVGWSLFDDLPPVPGPRLKAALATCFREDRGAPIDLAGSILHAYGCKIVAVRGSKPTMYALQHEIYGQICVLRDGRIVSL